MQDLIGLREEVSEETVPIKPEQLSGLLNSLSEKPELRLAIALVGLYGLRPAELMALKVKVGKLFVGQAKRNKATTPKKDRLTLPLGFNNLPGEGERVLKIYESGMVKLLVSITNAKDFKSCGHSFR